MPVNDFDMPGLKPFSFKADPELLDRAQYVAWHERTTLTAIINTNLETEVKKFEKANGPITPALLKKMQESK